MTECEAAKGMRMRGSRAEIHSYISYVAFEDLRGPVGPQSSAGNVLSALFLLLSFFKIKTD